MRGLRVSVQADCPVMLPGVTLRYWILVPAEPGKSYITIVRSTLANGTSAP